PVGKSILHDQAAGGGRGSGCRARSARHRAPRRHRLVGQQWGRRNVRASEHTGCRLAARRRNLMDGSSGDRPHLLLVDDDVTLCETLARALRARGFDVRVAHGAANATELARQRLPEFAVIDLKLPDAPGLKLLSTLRGLNPQTRVVVLTGYGS